MILQDRSRKELDFVKDGRNADRLRKNFEGVRGVRFPKIFWEYSSRHLLVMEFIDGTKVTNLTELHQMGIDLRKIAKTGFNAYLKQIFEDGFFHGDPHPGNLFVTSDGDLAIPGLRDSRCTETRKEVPVRTAPPWHHPYGCRDDPQRI